MSNATKGTINLSKSVHVRSSDLHGLGRLAVDATAGITDLVEAMHRNIAGRAAPLGAEPRGNTTGITGLVYKSIRGVTRVVGGGLDLLLGQLLPMLARKVDGTSAASALSSNERDAIHAALNGVLGDYLAETHNPLAINMQFRRDGVPLVLNQAKLAAGIPTCNGKIMVLVHGLCMDDRQWTRNGRDMGAALASDLGYTPVYLHYNSGLHISTNGKAFAALLERLVTQWPQPVEELVIIGHSMGGLVTRSACATADQDHSHWRAVLRKIVFLGTPHHGAPLERGGNWIDIILGVSPYTAPFARLGRVRSAGITDLRHGNLSDGDWLGRDRFARSHARPQIVALPEKGKCYLVAATKNVGAANDAAGSDGLVPLMSALGQHQDATRSLAVPKTRQYIARGLDHFDLLDDVKVYAKLKRWLSPS